MKKPITRGDKLLFASPLLLIVIAFGVYRWWKSRPLVLEIPDVQQIETLKYSPDGNRLAVFATVDSLGAGYVYDVGTRSKLCDLIAPTHDAAHLTYNPPSWSPDGTKIVATYGDESYGTTKLKFNISVPTGSQNFRYNRISKFAIWDAKSGDVTGEHLYAPSNEDSGALNIGFSPDGKKLIGYESQPSIFDATTGTRLKVLRGTFPQATSGQLNEELGLLAVLGGDGNQFQIFDTKNKRVIYQTSFIWASNIEWWGTVLCVPHAQGVLLWDGKTRKVLPQPKAAFLGRAFSGMRFSPDNNTVAYFDSKPLSSNPLRFSGAEELVVWDYQQNRELWRYSLKNSLTNIQWSPNGEFLSVWAKNEGGAPVRLLVLDQNGKLHFAASTKSNYSVWSPDNHHIAVIADTTKINIYDVGE